MHLSMLSQGEGGGVGVAHFDKAFMPEGVAFDFLDSPQGADIWFFPFPAVDQFDLRHQSGMKARYTW